MTKPENLELDIVSAFQIKILESRKARGTHRNLATLEAVEYEYPNLGSVMESLRYQSEPLFVGGGTLTLAETLGAQDAYDNDEGTVSLVFEYTVDDETSYFRIDGYYSSWDGVDWNSASLYEVDKVPVEMFTYPRKLT